MPLQIPSNHVQFQNWVCWHNKIIESWKISIHLTFNDFSLLSILNIYFQFSKRFMEKFSVPLRKHCFNWNLPSHLILNLNAEVLAKWVWSATEDSIRVNIGTEIRTLAESGEAINCSHQSEAKLEPIRVSHFKK